MLRKAVFVLGALAIALTVSDLQATETYTIDPVHSGVTFKIRHLVSKTPGRFDDFGGTITLDREDMTKSSVEFTIKAASIDTDNEDRDKHLRSADFFEVEKYPEITFKSTKIEKHEGDTYHVTGDFTMHGVTKSITIPVEILGFGPTPSGGKVAGFETKFEINRKDYGIIWNKALDAGGLILGEDVEVAITLEAGMKSVDLK
jgi:polyisoprenoid-binding protein YceI